MKSKQKIENRKYQYNQMIQIYKGEFDNFNKKNQNDPIEQGFLMAQTGGINKYYENISNAILNTNGLRTYSKSKGNLEERAVVLNTPVGNDSIVFTKEYIPKVKKHLYLTKIYSHNNKNNTTISLEDTQGNGSFNYIKTKQGTYDLRDGPLPEKYKKDLKEIFPNQKEEYLDPKLKEILENE
jgi:hypothetical protein